MGRVALWASEDAVEVSGRCSSCGRILSGSWTWGEIEEGARGADLSDLSGMAKAAAAAVLPNLGRIARQVLAPHVDPETGEVFSWDIPRELGGILCSYCRKEIEDGNGER